MTDSQPPSSEQPGSRASQREHYRAPLSHFARYRLPGTTAAEAQTAIVVDLSLGGCAIQCPDAIPEETQIDVMLAASPNESPTRFPGRVQHCRAADEGFQIGVKFDELDMSRRPVLTRLLGSNVLRKDAPAGE